MDNISISVIFAQLINFWILFYVFKKFVADKLNKAIRERKQLEKKLKDADKNYKLTIDKAYMERDEIMRGARDKADKIFSDMEGVALTKSAQIIQKAETRAALIVEWGKNEVIKERLAMEIEIKEHVLDLALKLNEKLFDSSKVDRDFMAKELEEIRK